MTLTKTMYHEKGIYTLSIRVDSVVLFCGKVPNFKTQNINSDINK